MPIFDYRCNNCNTKFEIFHLVKEKAEDIICPNCKSTDAQKLLSAFATVTGHHSHSESSSCETGTCGYNPYAGGCANGMCGLN